MNKLFLMYRESDKKVVTLHAQSPIEVPGFKLIGQVDQLHEDYVRDCLVYEDGEVSVSLPKLREKRLAEIRAERNQKLAESDRDWIVAASSGVPTQEIEARKQALRDLPEAAETQLNRLRSVNSIKSYNPF